MVLHVLGICWIPAWGSQPQVLRLFTTVPHVPPSWCRYHFRLPHHHYILLVHFVHHHNSRLVHHHLFLRLYLEVLQDLSSHFPPPLEVCPILNSEFRVQTWQRCCCTPLGCDASWMLYLLASYSLWLLCAGLSQGLLCSACILRSLIDPSFFRSCAHSLLSCCHDRGLLAVFQSSCFQPLYDFLI